MPETDPHPLSRLSADDLNMVAAFVLVSGSIKDLAREYGVSYPTMRNRLDGLIERLRKHDPMVYRPSPETEQQRDFVMRWRQGR